MEGASISCRIDDVPLEICCTPTENRITSTAIILHMLNKAIRCSASESHRALGVQTFVGQPVKSVIVGTTGQNLEDNKQGNCTYRITFDPRYFFVFQAESLVGPNIPHFKSNHVVFRSVNFHFDFLCFRPGLRGISDFVPNSLGGKCNYSKPLLNTQEQNIF